MVHLHTLLTDVQDSASDPPPALLRYFAAGQPVHEIEEAAEYAPVGH